MINNFWLAIWQMSWEPLKHGKVSSLFEMKCLPVLLQCRTTAVTFGKHLTCRPVWCPVWRGSETSCERSRKIVHCPSLFLHLQDFTLVSSDNSRGAWGGGGGGVRRGGRKIPQHPFMLVLAFLGQEVLLLPLFPSSLVVVVLLQVPDRRPALLLKVFLVLYADERAYNGVIVINKQYKHFCWII